MEKCKPWLVCCCILLFVLCTVALICLCIASYVGAGCSSSSFRHAAVAADSQICSEIGKNMLLQGGSAVDGAIAALLCTSVINPQSMGIGGGSIFAIRNKTGNVTIYNFRETVPRSFKTNLLSDCPTTFKLSTGKQSSPSVWSQMDFSSIILHDSCSRPRSALQSLGLAYGHLNRLRHLLLVLVGIDSQLAADLTESRSLQYKSLKVCEIRDCYMWNLGDIKVCHFSSLVRLQLHIFQLNTVGSQWIGVPGELRGYEVVHRQYGKLPWATLFEPTIKLAREGIPMPAYLANLLNSSFVKNHVESSSLCKILCNGNKTVLRKGDVLRFPKLAETMETIAEEGAEAFYTGKIGRDLIQDIEEAGGTLKMEDLKSFQVQVDNALKVSLGDTQMHVPPPPAGGTLLAFILKIMKGFSLTSNSLVGDKKIQMYHHYIEAAKFANGQKRSISDPVFNKRKSADHLIDPSFIDGIRKLITSNHTHENSYYNNIKPSSDHIGTTHVAVLDKDGLAISATSTINQLFGGTIYSPRTGIILNNELADFCWRADTLRAGERPPSSMTPAILESKSGGLLVIGGSGGSMITTAVAMSIMNRLWLGMNIRDAIAAPIIFVDAKNNVNFEPGFDKSVIEGLKALGHKVGGWKYFLNVVNAVEKENGCIEAVSDSRKIGKSAGY